MNENLKNKVKGFAWTMDALVAIVLAYNAYILSHIEGATSERHNIGTRLAVIEASRFTASDAKELNTAITTISTQLAVLNSRLTEVDRLRTRIEKLEAR